ncbi:bifunctional diaminohydroxyphosphoribosylaminopyrimidine deaminase/5-amino-6-(5-phosphoribosylamino)uracil reductase RibD [Dongia deserti]|uniref:bifunctional diaminohydroxyphosphoribosylaminopyrimidine deaminase/5-amino-6-(5-phosphoribosylamino)uracil reductase RibD n=1 Tax=Dongia deserti TaxID=2268030 RepID=UPI000E64F18C|nr:bifunctional diaminohydroxyphosphoribosylaminopyrimidine deaminase/5-amino-6-(5-phosphoribosylamino)uracil reductase RibD [Dongia deserti]
MAAALSLAARNLGQVWPNPAVGCVIVDKAGHVVGRGWTQPGGRPHAETEALKMAGERGRGGTAYVTLEPCAHHGKTPPCAEALVAAGIARCVTALEDPDLRVSGRGLAALKQAGIAVETGVLAEGARELNVGFLTRVTTGRPFVVLKLATSLDGRIATRAGESRWITGEEARAFGHRLRATHDAIAVGSGTVLADDPELTCRLKGLEHRSPVRLVFDRRGRVPASAKVMTEAPPTWVVGAGPTDASKKAAQHIEIAANQDADRWLPAVFQELGKAGLTRVLVEGGATLATALLSAGLVDRLYWFRAPIVIGGDGLPGIAPLAVDRLAGSVGLRCVGRRTLGNDVLELYGRAA